MGTYLATGIVQGDRYW